MKHARGIRLLALVLVLATMAGVVSAASYTTDLSGDGKVNVWDLQLAVNQSKGADHETAILNEILGGGDELHPNADGEYEIYTAFGLNQMAAMINKNGASGLTFRLMQDVDLQGQIWRTTETFYGILEADGHRIYNVTVADEVAVSTSTSYAGFFGKIGKNSAVRNLFLENVNVILTEDSNANFVGLLAGSVSGEITNCTTVGSITDPRTTLTSTCYIGTLCGRIENVSAYTVPGITVSDSSILMTAESDEVAAISGKSQQVLCKMGVDFAELSYPEDAEKEYQRQLGIAGWAPSYDSFKQYNWQDISGACEVKGSSGNTYNLVDPILVARRQAAVDKMYEICTVEWTPSQDMTIYYYKIGTGDNAGNLKYSTKTWKAGQLYHGMPYNHGSGSLERFKAYMDTKNGLLTVKSSVPTASFYYTYTDIRTALSNYTDTTFQTALTFTDTVSGKTYDLLPGLTLSDQALTLGETVKSADHAGFSRYLGNDCSQAIQWAWREVVSSDVANGGTVISGVTQMNPSATNQSRYGVQPVGYLVPSAFTVEGTCTMFDEKTTEGFMYGYAHASRGDGLIVQQVAGAHSRMIAYDPIVIRNYRGVVDQENSYLITHEQGGGNNRSGTNANGVAWTSTTSTNDVYTFATLMDETDHTTTTDGSACQHYYPMTLPAFHNVDNEAVTSTVSYSGGVVKSNFYILSLTVDGNEVFPSVGQHQTTNSTTRVGSGYRDAHVQETVSDFFGDVTGKTITVKLSNGDVYTVDADSGTVTKQ